jgi:hypothetical protein
MPLLKAGDVRSHVALRLRATGVPVLERGSRPSLVYLLSVEVRQDQFGTLTCAVAAFSSGPTSRHESNQAWARSGVVRPEPPTVKDVFATIDELLAGFAADFRKANRR